MGGYQLFTTESGEHAEVGLGIIENIAENSPALAGRLNAERGAFADYECQQIATILDDILVTDGEDGEWDTSDLRRFIQFFQNAGQVTMIRVLT